MRKKTGILAIYIIVIVSLTTGYVNLVKKEIKPSLTVTGVYSKIANYESETHQIFTGYVENNGNGEAHNVTAFILWSDGENQYKQSDYLGTMLPKNSQSFQIVFNEENVHSIKWSTYWVEYSNP
jgi:hypothetical protein